MKIKNNILHDNKTRLYLLPVTKIYGKEFFNNFSKIFKLGFGINDFTMPDNLKFDNHIFILLQSDLKSENFNDFLTWIRKQSYYEKDYAFDNIKNGDKHMVIVRIPKRYKYSYNAFVKGEYSKMYSEQDMRNLFNTGDTRLPVLTKSDNAMKKFVSKINADYNTEFEFGELAGECEYPINENINNETFNYNVK